MTKSEQYYVSKLAIVARKHCVDDGLLNADTRKLDFETLKSIVNHFGGSLFKDENSNSYFRVINNGPKFDICIGNDIKAEDESIAVLTAISIPLFDADILSKDCEINISENKLIEARKKHGISYSEPLYFARAFLMPEDLYDQSMVENTTNDGKFDCIEMAKDFGIGYMKVLTRGEELGKWH